MNKKFSALLLLIIIMVAVFASACTDSESGGIKSDTVISVAENIVYDESKWVGYLAEEKDICLAADGVSDYKIIIPYSDADAFREDAEYLELLDSEARANTWSEKARGILDELAKYE